MDQYTSFNADPPLTETETLLVRMLLELDTAQLVHRFYDPVTPASPSFWKRIFSHRQAMQHWEEAWERYDADYGRSNPLDPMSLRKLFERIDRQEELEPNVADRSNLFFDHFFVAQRFLGSTSDRELCFLVAGPLSGEAFRCLAFDCTGRFFCTTAEKTHCDPPEEGDFQRFFVQAVDTDSDDEPVRSAVYLPGCYGPWSLLADASGKKVERIVEG